MPSSLFGRGKKMSSVDERRDLRVSESVSERKELDLRLSDAFPSANVVALPSGRCLRSWEDGLTRRPVWSSGGSVMDGDLSEAMEVVREALCARTR